MLFLYRPRQTWMPFAAPRNRTEQAAYNRQLQAKFDSTRRVAPVVPATRQDTAGHLRALNELRRVGALTDAEFESAKSKLLSR